jgi:serine/threonine-protein kinase RsbW
MGTRAVPVEKPMTEQGSAIDLTLENKPSATRKLRTAVDRIADESSLTDQDRFDLKLAATEALTNALKGAPAGHVVDVTLTASENVVDIEILDPGVFSPVRAALYRGPEAESGRGIPMMLALVDRVDFAQTGRGTRVRLRKRVA